MIPAARFDERRDKWRGEIWNPITAESTIRDLLVQIPLYKWPIPKDHTCFRHFCDHGVISERPRRFQMAHTRKRNVPGEDLKKQRVWDGESML
jgi:hypothetical protein